MKLLLILSLISFSVYAKSPLADFNQTINEEIKTEIKKDDEAFKKKGPMKREPASVEVEVALPEEPEKIEKNVRQIGPKTW